MRQQQKSEPGKRPTLRMAGAFWLLTWAALVPLAGQGGGADLLTGDPLKGRRLFVSKGCIECHAIRGVGGSVGPDLGLRVFNNSVYEIGGILWNHSPLMSRKMKQMGIRRPHFESQEMLDLISFLFFLNYFDWSADPQRGAQLWVEKQCAMCHSMGGQGGGIGPALDQIGSSLNAVFLAQGMWNHGIPMLETLRRLDMPLPRFSGNEMVDLTAFIRQKNRNPRRELFSMGDPRIGSRLFRSKGCTSCHGRAGGSAPQLGGPDLQATVSQIAGQMWNHLPRMADQMARQGIGFPTFSGEEMSHLIAYLYSRAYVGRPGLAEKGKTVFQDKGCVSCHQGTQGPGPDLAAASADQPLGMLPTMWNHALNMESLMKEKQIVWPRFEDQEMADLQAYLRNLVELKEK